MSWPQETKHLNKSLLPFARKAPEQPKHLILVCSAHIQHSRFVSFCNDDYHLDAPALSASLHR